MSIIWWFAEDEIERLFGYQSLLKGILLYLEINNKRRTLGPSNQSADISPITDICRKVWR
jgi:hypothetical protein